MNVKIKATNLELTSAISEYVNTKMEDVDRFIKTKDPESVLAYVEVEKTTDHHQKGEIMRAEINLQIGGKKFRAESSQEDLYAAIDIAKDEMVRSVKENQDKRRTLFRKGGAAVKDLLKGFRK